MAKKRTPINWTVNKVTGRSNSSPQFETMVNEVERLIRNDAHQLLAGNAHSTARLILSQLTHVHGFAPRALTRA